MIGNMTLEDIDKVIELITNVIHVHSADAKIQENFILVISNSIILNHLLKKPSFLCIQLLLQSVVDLNEIPVIRLAAFHAVTMITEVILTEEVLMILSTLSVDALLRIMRIELEDTFIYPVKTCIAKALSILITQSLRIARIFLLKGGMNMLMKCLEVLTVNLLLKCIK